MISAFPSPILSVAADVVKDLEGEDALCSLWTLFTKCKESLKDGRRLENISWRLWYRELAAAQTTPSSSPGSLSPPFSEKRSPSPITPVSEDGHLSQQVPLPHPSLTPTSDISTAHSWHAQNSANTVITAGRRLSTASAPMERRKSHSSIGVGKMILDILPAKLDVNSEKEKAARPTRPTPTAATIASVPQIAQPRPMVATLPTVQLPATPPHPERASFPRVVVVNPTPHPTPPATPSVPHPPSTAAAQPSSHLLPPPPARSLISATAPRHRKPPSPPRRAKHASPATTTKSVSPPRLQQQEQQEASSSLTSKQQPTSSSPAGSHDAIPTLPTRSGVGASAADPSPKPRPKYNDETLKASDRRFFLPDSGGSPSPERPPSAVSDLSDLLHVESPTVPSLTAEQGQGRDQVESELDVKEAEADRDQQLQEQAPEHAQSPSSATSSQLKGPTAAVGAGGTGGRKRQQVQVRKNKERGHAPARPAALQRLHSHGLRTTSAKKGAHAHAGHGQAGQPPHTADAKKTTFNIGSVSSNGSREDRSVGGPSKEAEKEKEKDVGKEKGKEAKEKETGKETREKEAGKGKEREKEKGERRRDASSSRTRRPSSPAPNPPKKSMSTPLLPATAAVTATATAATSKTNGAGPSQPRRGIVISTSSEYDTTDTDDDSEWASEDSSEDREKDKSRKAKAAEDARLREAAEEAKRQRDMFAKVPKRSYSNLNRVQSGLLSQLLNPDPNLFPPNHPYRSIRSTQDMTQLARPAASALQMQMRKSTAAVPLAAQVQVTAQAPAAPTPAQQQRQQSENGRGYRKGRPEEEVEFSSDDDENPDDTIQVSRSLAQQKLAALADPNRRRHSDRALPPSGLQMSKQMQMEGRPQLPSIATAPIPLSHPYNLPAPAPPMTPRATRRQMLQTELSESLRRNLLWERQVSRVNLTGRRAGTLGSGLRPLTAVNGDPGVQQQQQQAQAQGSGQQAQVPDDKEEKRRRAMARNRSWADEYHYSGW